MYTIFKLIKWHLHLNNCFNFTCFEVSFMSDPSYPCLIKGQIHNENKSIFLKSLTKRPAFFFPLLPWRVWTAGKAHVVWCQQAARWQRAFVPRKGKCLNDISTKWPTDTKKSRDLWAMSAVQCMDLEMCTWKGKKLNYLWLFLSLPIVSESPRLSAEFAIGDWMCSDQNHEIVLV